MIQFIHVYPQPNAKWWLTNFNRFNMIWLLVPPTNVLTHAATWTRSKNRFVHEARYDEHSVPEYSHRFTLLALNRMPSLFASPHIRNGSETAPKAGMSKMFENNTYSLRAWASCGRWAMAPGATEDRRSRIVSCLGWKPQCMNCEWFESSVDWWNYVLY